MAATRVRVPEPNPASTSASSRLSATASRMPRNAPPLWAVEPEPRRALGREHVKCPPVGAHRSLDRRLCPGPVAVPGEVHTGSTTTAPRSANNAASLRKNRRPSSEPPWAITTPQAGAPAGRIRVATSSPDLSSTGSEESARGNGGGLVRAHPRHGRRSEPLAGHRIRASIRCVGTVCPLLTGGTV